MPTKAESHRSQQQRDSQAKKTKNGPAKTDNLSKQGASSNAARNLTTAPAQMKHGAALESSANGAPSRKSTRSISGQVKLDSNPQRRQIRRAHSPQARAARGA